MKTTPLSPKLPLLAWLFIIALLLTSIKTRSQESFIFFYETDVGLAFHNEPSANSLGDCDFIYNGTLDYGQLFSNDHMLATFIPIEPFDTFIFEEIKFSILTNGALPSSLDINFGVSQSPYTIDEIYELGHTFDETDMSFSHIGSFNEEYEIYEVTLHAENTYLQVHNGFDDTSALIWMVFEVLNPLPPTYIYWLSYVSNQPDNVQNTLQYSPDSFTWVQAPQQIGLKVQASCTHVDPEDPEVYLFLEVTDQEGSPLDCVNENYYITVEIGSTVNSTFNLKDDTGLIIADAEIGPLYIFGPYEPESSHTFQATQNDAPYLVTTKTIAYPGDYILCDIGIENWEKDEFKIFPSPFKDQLHLSSGQNIEELNLYDLSGKLVFQHKNVGKETQINTAQFSPGYYILKVNQNHQEKTYRVLKK